MEYKYISNYMYEGFSKDVHPRIINSIMRWITSKNIDLAFFANFLTNVNFIKDSPDVERMAVNVKYSGMCFYYNTEWVENSKEIEFIKHFEFVMVHEELHLLHKHNSRRRRGDIKYNHYIANIAKDYAINYDICQFFPNIDVEQPSWTLKIPKEYEGEIIYEPIYDWVLEQEKLWDNGLCKKYGHPILSGGDGSYGEETDSKELKDLRMQLEFKNYQFDTHLEDEVSEDIAKSIIDKALDQAKKRGLVKGNITKLLEKIEKNPIDYTLTLRKATLDFISCSIERSYRRLNNRGIEGVKGRIKVGDAINCIWDTSGSMYNMHEIVLGTIYRNDISVNLIQIDAQEVKSVTNIKSISQFKKLAMHGGGGTELQPAIDFISNSSKFRNLNTLILTDGWTDNLDVTGLKKTLIVTVEDECPIKNHRNNIKQVKLKNFKNV